MSLNHLMIIDGQPAHQVVNNQIQSDYEQKPIAELVTIPQQQSQTVYYMDKSGTISSQLSTQVEAVELQPIVLNHQLGNQVSLVQRPIKTTISSQQFALMQQVQSINSHQVIRTPVSMPNQQFTIQLTSDHQNQHFIGTQQIQQKQPEVVMNQMNMAQVSRQQITQQNNHQFQSNLNEYNQNPQQKVVHYRGRQINSEQLMTGSGDQGTISLSDGRTVSTAEYKEMLLKQKQIKLNIPGEVKRNQNLRGRTPTVNRIVNNSLGMRPQGSQSQPPQSGRMISTIPSRMQQQQRQQLQLANTPQAQQQCRRNNPNYVIQPPKLNKQRQAEARPLPSCVPSSQIKKIIESTPITEEYSDSIRMLVMLANGEQRLITFTLPNQACTIQEILEQVGVPIQPDMPIEVSEANSDGINYIVTVGFLQIQGENETVEPAESGSQTGFEQQLTPETPKEEEQPKYIEGKMAVCGYCGILSDDFNKCMRCKTKLPENVKAITAFSTNKKLDVTKKAEKSNLNNSNGNGKETPLMKKKAARVKTSESEPVILTLSSDEEGEESEQQGNSSIINKNILKKLGSAVSLSPIVKEPTKIEIQKPLSAIEVERAKITPENTKTISLHCRTVRIGSYRTIPKENVIIDYSSVTIKVATMQNSKEVVTIKVDRNEIVKVLISFQKQLPVLFYYLRPETGSKIRELLNMQENDLNYFDPLSENESKRRLTLLPENISDEAKIALIQIYRNALTANILEELTFKEANDILIKTCPKELTLANFQTSASSSEVKLLFTYPPEGKGRIAINTEDYMCLGSDQFLNDVIIDFYLKYLVNNLTSEERERIHVFSTFFYKRLTTKPGKISRKIQPAELDPNLSPAEKRHARVKTWTKNINLFEKDYVIVPINEHSHWFLAIICFPGLEGSQTTDGQPIKIDVATKKKENSENKKKKRPSTPVKKEEPPCEFLESDKDEAEGDESELESDDSDEAPTVTSHANRPPIKQPCILIFDSLAGARRSRIVATLRDYLTCEYKSKYEKEKIFNKDNIKGACPKVPQQTNFTDCGLYLLQYVEHFFMEPIKDYYIPINSLKNWFDELTVTRKREDISILIKSLMMDYDRDIELLPEILFPTKNGVVVDQITEDDEEMEDEMSDNEELHTPPDSSDHELEHTPIQTAEMEFEEKDADSVQQLIDPNELSSQGVNELSSPKIPSNRDTLSYLKAKRIVRHKNLESPSKKLKTGDE